MERGVAGYIIYGRLGVVSSICLFLYGEGIVHLYIMSRRAVL